LKVENSIGVGLPQPTAEGRAIVAMPNPADGNVGFLFGDELATPTAIVVFDALGRAVVVERTTLLDGMIRLTTSGLAAGAYRVHFEDQAGRIVGSSSFILAR
jgi:hypothetical protein